MIRNETLSCTCFFLFLFLLLLLLFLSIKGKERNERSPFFFFFSFYHSFSIPIYVLQILYNHYLSDLVCRERRKESKQACRRERERVRRKTVCIEREVELVKFHSHAIVRRTNAGANLSHTYKYSHKHSSKWHLLIRNMGEKLREQLFHTCHSIGHIMGNRYKCVLD